MPFLARKNTAIFDFREVPGGIPKGDSSWKWFSGGLEFLRYLNIPHDEIACYDVNEIMKEIIVKFDSEKTFSSRMDQFGTSIAYQHPDGNTYPVPVHGRQGAPRYTSIKIRWVPLEMPLEDLRRELEPFGKVEGMSRFRINESDYKVDTERVTVTMTLAQTSTYHLF